MRVQTLASNQPLSLKNVFQRPKDESEFIQGQSLSHDIFIASEHMGETSAAVIGVMGGMFLATKALPDVAPILTVLGGGYIGYKASRGFCGLANAAGNLTTRATGSAGAGRFVRIGLKVGVGAALAQTASPVGAASVVASSVVFGGAAHGLVAWAKATKDGE
ncbi:MAG: hypothetical protein AB7S38_25335 [Vulcanimicrobiota bacterium]